MATESTEYERTTILRRLWSAIRLVALVVLLGALTAGILGVVVVGGISLIDHALG